MSLNPSDIQVGDCLVSTGSFNWYQRGSVSLSTDEGDCWVVYSLYNQDKKIELWRMDGQKLYLNSDLFHIRLHKYFRLFRED